MLAGYFVICRRFLDTHSLFHILYDGIGLCASGFVVVACGHCSLGLHIELDFGLGTRGTNRNLVAALGKVLQHV